MPRDSADSVRADSLRPVAHPLKGVVVAGTRLSDVDPGTPARIDSLDLRYGRSTPDAAIGMLSRIPGVSMSNDQGATLQPQVAVHGFTLSPVVGTPQGIGVFLDGVRFNEPDAQQVNFDLLPLAAIDRASLVRGSDPLFGRNALGGALLLFTRRGKSTRESTIEVGGGSFGQRYTTITSGGRTHGIDGFVMAHAADETGWRHATESKSRTVFATIGHTGAGPDDTSRDALGDLALSVLYAHDRIFQAGSLPESTAAINPRFNYTPGDAFAPHLLQVSLRNTRSLFGGVMRTTVFDRRNRYDQFNGNVPPPNSNIVVRNLSIGGTTEWTRSLPIGTHVLTYTVGGEYTRDDSKFRLSNVPETGPDSVTTLARVKDDNAALFSRVMLPLTSALTLTAALRADYVRIPYRDQLDASNNGTNVYHPVMPQLGVTYAFTDAIRGFASFSRGFRAPAPLELACASPDAPCSLPSALGADPLLLPVTTNNYEAGVDAVLPHRSDINVNVFWTDVLNDILFASPTLTQVYFTNVPRTRRAGIETSGAVGLPYGSRIFASYSYIAATFRSTVQIATLDTSPEPARPGDIFPSSPRHRGRVGVGVSRMMGQVALGSEFDVQGVSSQYLRGDEANRHHELARYAVAGLRGSMQWSHYGLEFGIENVFNRRYAMFGIIARNELGSGSDDDEDGPLTNFVTPAQPRRVTLSVSMKF
jgi:outer membrane receptor protein involved in Fe transport